MDYQHRVGGKTGTAGPLSRSESNAERRERLRKLAMETIDLKNDPYFMRNHLGTYECRLCLTLHTHEASYLTHTQGRKHQTNLARRAAREAQLAARSSGNATIAAPGAFSASLPSAASANVGSKPESLHGRPQMALHYLSSHPKSKAVDSMGRELATGLLLVFYFPTVAVVQDLKSSNSRNRSASSQIAPAYRIMSAFEQRHEVPNKNFQYLVVAVSPPGTYDTVAVRVPFRPLQQRLTFDYWDVDSHLYFVQLMFADNHDDDDDHADED
jgi:splicing factor 3A subunit 2